MDGLFKGCPLCLEGATKGASWSVPPVDEAILTAAMTSITACAATPTTQQNRHRRGNLSPKAASNTATETNEAWPWHLAATSAQPQDQLCD